MRFVAPFAASAVMAAAVSAAPSPAPESAVKVPMTKHHNVQSMDSLVKLGKARLERINNIHKDDEDLLSDASQEDAVKASGSVTNEIVTYLASVKIGGKPFDLIVDTGSSNLWCGAHGKCEPSGTGKSTGRAFGLKYGSGKVQGTEFLDQVSFAGLTVSKQSLGSAKTSKGFGQGIDGILGLGPVGLTQGTVQGQQTVPTFMNNLYAQKKIPTEVLGVSFAPVPGAQAAKNGELTLGGTDSSKYSGSITYIPKLTTGIASHYWGLKVTGASVGGKSVASNADAQAIVDTGTTLIYLPTTVFKNVASALGGRTSQGTIVFEKKPTKTVTIELGGHPFTLTPSQYLIPQSEYPIFGLPSGAYYAFIVEGGSSGIKAIIGQKFLENYYSVFDTTNHRIGFAKHV